MVFVTDVGVIQIAHSFILPVLNVQNFILNCKLVLAENLNDRLLKASKNLWKIIPNILYALYKKFYIVYDMIQAYLLLKKLDFLVVVLLEILCQLNSILVCNRLYLISYIKTGTLKRITYY